MKKKPIIQLGGFLFIAGIALATLTSSTNGSPGGKTNSPGDGSSCLQCHGGSLNNGPGTPLIQSNIPSGGYIPGNTYTIDVSISETGISKFGFELTAEDISNQKAGTFLLTNTTETKLVNNGKAVTHTGSGVSGSGNKTWSVDWTAPSAGSGTITFYGILNASNNNNNASGDNIYTHTLSIGEDISTGLKVKNSEVAVQIYPNPGNNIFHLKIGREHLKNNALKIYSITGKEIIPESVKFTENRITFSISSSPKGLYFAQMQLKNGEKLIRKILKQ